MEYVTLGRTGANVSRLGFGGAPAGLTNYLEQYTPANKQQRRQVIEAIQRAFELGVTYFDTAPAYGNGESEVIFGEALAGLGDRVFIATKLVPDTTNVRKSIECSLKRLRRDTLDLLQIHGSSYSRQHADAFFGSGGIVQQMNKLKQEGLVRAIGFTTEDNNPAVYKFIASGYFDVIQLCYNLLYQHPAEFTRPFGTMFEAEAQEMGIVTMRTVTSGLFQRWVEWVNPDNTFDYTPSLLQFVLSNPMVDVALVGMRDVDVVQANVSICEDMAGRIDLNTLHEKYV
jgi:aryl-alcohol dehydrogenase-like predicted oxidoreductase